MTDNTRTEALCIADEFRECLERDTIPSIIDVEKAVAELCRLHARIAELEAQLEAIVAGGVNGPLIGQPQAMPDLSALTERGEKAWAGVDAQALREGRWYMVNKDGMATLCADEADAQREAADAQAIWPGMGPHSAVQLVDAGRASLSANAGEPTCDMRTVVAVAVTMLYDTHPEDVCRVFDRNDLETIVSITEPLGHGRVEDIYRDAWDHVAAPPTAQAEGWRLIATAPKDGTYLLLWEQYSTNPFVGCWAFGAWTVSHEHVDAEGGWDGANVVDSLSMPITHWMPIPAPPTSAEGVEHG